MKNSLEESEKNNSGVIGKIGHNESDTNTHTKSSTSADMQWGYATPLPVAVDCFFSQFSISVHNFVVADIYPIFCRWFSNS